MRFCHEPLAREIWQPLLTPTTLNEITLPYLTLHRVTWSVSIELRDKFHESKTAFCFCNGRNDCRGDKNTM